MIDKKRRIIRLYLGCFVGLIIFAVFIATMPSQTRPLPSLQSGSPKPATAAVTSPPIKLDPRFKGIVSDPPTEPLEWVLLPKGAWGDDASSDHFLDRARGGLKSMIAQYGNQLILACWNSGLTGKYSSSYAWGKFEECLRISQWRIQNGR